MTEYGAYSPRKVYSVEDMRDLVEYARIRGVKIVAEFDAPAHAGKLLIIVPNSGIKYCGIWKKWRMVL